MTAVFALTFAIGKRKHVKIAYIDSLSFGRITVRNPQFLLLHILRRLCTLKKSLVPGVAGCGGTGVWWNGGVVANCELGTNSQTGELETALVASLMRRAFVYNGTATQCRRRCQWSRAC